jgi:hypothetical protein
VTAERVLAELRAAGIILTCMGDKLRASPKSRLTDHWRGCIRNHKPELLALLSELHCASSALGTGHATSEVIDLTAFAERCAVLQYDHGLSRQDAERMAAQEVGQECIEGLHAAAIAQWCGEIHALQDLNSREGERLVSLSLDFLASDWAAMALAYGWDEIALFAVFDGPWPTLRSRLDGQGLIPAIALSLLAPQVVEIDVGAAILSSRTGSRLRHERFVPGAQYCDVWWSVLGLQALQGNKVKFCR